MQYQNGNQESLEPRSNRQHGHPHQGSMPSTQFRPAQEGCFLLTSPFIEPSIRALSPSFSVPIVPVYEQNADNFAKPNVGDYSRLR